MKNNSGKALFRIILILLPLRVFCQEGNPVLKNHFHTSEETDHFNICIRQGPTGAMLFANSKGLLSYDGHEWKLTTTENIPTIIEPDKESGKIFAGFYKDFGYFIKDETGLLTYYPTSPGKNFIHAEITRILIDEVSVYYCNENVIYKVNKFSDDIESFWHSPKEKIFTGFLLFHNKLFVNIEEEGLHLVMGKKFVPIHAGKIFSHAEILFGLPYNDTCILVGSTLDELHLFNGKEFSKHHLESTEYLKNNFLTDGIDIGNQQIALSTLAGGFIIADKFSGKTIYTVNSSSGLPDNEVYALGSDHNGGVWVTHHYGVSRLDPHLPYREYSNYHGLEGNLLSTLYFKNTLYVSTTEGVFFLTKKEKPQVQNISSQEQYYEEKKSEKKSFHHFLDQVFHKRKFKETESPTPKKTAETIPANSRKVKEEIPEYYFRKIKGISAKCRQLIPVEDYILVCSNKGLFEIKEFQSRAVIKEEYINHILPLNKRSFYVGLRNGLLSLTVQNGKWHIEKILNEHVNVYSIAKDYMNNLWIGSNGKILKLKTNVQNKIIEKEEFHLQDFHNELIVVRSIHGLPTFFLSDGVYYYSNQQNKVLRDPKLNSSSAVYRFNASQEQITWMRSEEGWKGLDIINDKNDILIPYLSFFKNIRAIHLDNDKSLWIIDGNNQLFRLNLNKEILRNLFDMHILQIKSTAGNILPIKDLDLPHSENSLHFYLSAPFFLDEGSVQYQYFIEGIMNEWSDWSRDNKIELTYLPVGEHVLHARARNGLGQISDLKKISIAILPPYWKSGWFFVLEVIFFFSLIVASILLNRSNHSRFLTRAITFLTLILVVEFIIYQLESVVTVGNSENPLIRFSFNVMLALMISPVEKLLELVVSKRRRRIAKMMLLMRRHL